MASRKRQEVTAYTRFPGVLQHGAGNLSLTNINPLMYIVKLSSRHRYQTIPQLVLARIRQRVEFLIRQLIYLPTRFVKTVTSERRTKFLTQSVTKIQCKVEILARRLTYCNVVARDQVTGSRSSELRYVVGFYVTWERRSYQRITIVKEQWKLWS